MQTDAKPPFLYAGFRLSALAPTIPACAKAAEGEILELGGDHYICCDGYLVPYYPAGEKDETQIVTREKLALDLTKRFFRNAEIGINVRFTHADIERLNAYYDRLPTGSEERRAAGALLVGAMMNRIERLSHAMLHHRAMRPYLEAETGIHDLFDLKMQHQLADINSDSLKAIIRHCTTLFSSSTIDQTLEIEYRQLSDEEKFSEARNGDGQPIGIYPRQLRHYYDQLTRDSALLSCVRRRDRAMDREGILADMIRDAGKAAGIPLMMIHANRVHKIAEAMAGIDTVEHLLRAAISHTEFNGIPKGLDKAIAEFAAIARRRCGVKTDDAMHYIPVEIAFKVAERRLFCLVREAIENASVELLEGLRLIRRGIALIDDMAEIRQSRNIQHGDDSKAAPLGIERLELRINAYLKGQPAPFRTAALG